MNKSYKLLRKLRERLKGGHVKRYHTRPEVSDGQDVASHSWRTVVILTTLWPDTSRECVLWTLYHDVTEAELGDLPATTKWKYKDIATAFSFAEKAYEKVLELPINFEELTLEEQNRAKIADILELILHCKRQMQLGNSLAEIIHKRGIDHLEMLSKSSPKQMTLNNEEFRTIDDFELVFSLLEEIK